MLTVKKEIATHVLRQSHSQLQQAQRNRERDLRMIRRAIQGGSRSEIAAEFRLSESNLDTRIGRVVTRLRNLEKNEALFKAYLPAGVVRLKLHPEFWLALLDKHEAALLRPAP